MATEVTSRWQRAIVLTIIMGAQLMMVLDASIITTALPHLITDVGFSPESLPWVQNAYVLAFGGFLLLGARVGDLAGRRRVFVWGVAVFGIASLIAGVAWSVPVLLAARALQGLAAAFAVPSTLALLVGAYPEPERRSQAIAIYSAVIGAGASVGIIVGGVFTDLLSWRLGLLINVPVGIVIIVLAPRFLAETPVRRGRFDVAGALAITCAMTALVFGLIESSSQGWSSQAVLGSLTIAGALLIAFVLIERRSPEPVLPLSLFRSVTRVGAYVGRILIVGAMFSTFYFLSQYLQFVLGYSALQAGLSFIPLTGMFFATVYVIAPLGRLFGQLKLLIASLAIALIGMTWLATVDASTAYLPSILLPLLVLGVGQGIAIVLLTQLGMADVAPELAGAGSGLINTAHQVGGSIGLALLVSVFVAAGGDRPDTADRVAGFQAVFSVAAVFYVLAMICAVVMFVAARPRSVTNKISLRAVQPAPRP